MTDARRGRGVERADRSGFRQRSYGRHGWLARHRERVV